MMLSISVDDWLDPAKRPWTNLFSTVRRLWAVQPTQGTEAADLDADTPEKRGALMTNAHFRLMLNLLTFARSDEDNSEYSRPYTECGRG